MTTTTTPVSTRQPARELCRVATSTDLDEEDVQGAAAREEQRQRLVGRRHAVVDVSWRLQLPVDGPRRLPGHVLRGCP